MMRVGGASGPSYGTLFTSLGKSLAQDSAPEPVAEPAHYAAALGSAVVAIKHPGKPEPGCKTLLDVLT